jgi:hypothetical protein
VDLFGRSFAVGEELQALPAEDRVDGGVAGGDLVSGAREALDRRPGPLHGFGCRHFGHLGAQVACDDSAFSPMTAAAARATEPVPLADIGHDDAFAKPGAPDELCGPRLERLAGQEALVAVRDRDPAEPEAALGLKSPLSLR